MTSPTIRITSAGATRQERQQVAKTLMADRDRVRRSTVCGTEIGLLFLDRGQTLFVQVDDRAMFCEADAHAIKFRPEILCEWIDGTAIDGAERATLAPRLTAAYSLLYDEPSVSDKLPLPWSYFMLTAEHGYCRALGHFLVHAPVGGADSLQEQGKRIAGLVEQAVRERSLACDPDGSPELALRLFPFATSQNGEYLAWDTASPRDTEHGVEYPIYCIAARMGGIRFAGHDLNEVIDRLTGPQVTQLLGPGYAPLPRTFESLDPCAP